MAATDTPACAKSRDPLWPRRGSHSADRPPSQPSRSDYRDRQGRPACVGAEARLGLAHGLVLPDARRSWRRATNPQGANRAMSAARTREAFAERTAYDLVHAPGRDGSDPIGCEPPRTGREIVRLGGLRRFAFAITFLNVLGHAVAGFRDIMGPPTRAAIATAWSAGGAARVDRRPRDWPAGSLARRPSDRLLPLGPDLRDGRLDASLPRRQTLAGRSGDCPGGRFEGRPALRDRRPHATRPEPVELRYCKPCSLLFPQVGIAAPYQFTEALSGYGNWVLPALLIDRRDVLELPLHPSAARSSQPGSGASCCRRRCAPLLLRQRLRRLGSFP